VYNPTGSWSIKIRPSSPVTINFSKVYTLLDRVAVTVAPSIVDTASSESTTIPEIPPGYSVKNTISTTVFPPSVTTILSE